MTQTSLFPTDAERLVLSRIPPRYCARGCGRRVYGSDALCGICTPAGAKR